MSDITWSSPCPHVYIYKYIIRSTPILWALLPASSSSLPLSGSPTGTRLSARRRDQLAVLANLYPKKGKITITNVAPEFGVCITPVWFGIHDGTFDTYNGGDPLAPEFVPLVEDGMPSQVSELFTASSGAVVDGVVGSGPLCSGDTATFNFDLPPHPANETLYFSYATMIIPSNDAWASNGNPMAYPVMSVDGEFQPFSVTVLGTDVIDAGTELNDELPSNTPFLGMSEPGTGVDTPEGPYNQDHGGFNPVGSGGILDDERFINADFTADGYEIFTISVTEDGDGHGHDDEDDGHGHGECAEMEQMHEAENACVEANGCSGCEDVDFGDDCAANKQEHCAEISCCPACEEEIRAAFGCEHGAECGDDLGTCEDGGEGGPTSSGTKTSMALCSFAAFLLGSIALAN